MSQKVYYHNITQRFFNINDLCDAVESANPNDIIMFSVRGNALLFDMKDGSNEGGFDEYDYVRIRFAEYFNEWHHTNL